MRRLARRSRPPPRGPDPGTTERGQDVLEEQAGERFALGGRQHPARRCLALARVFDGQQRERHDARRGFSAARASAFLRARSDITVSVTTAPMPRRSTAAACWASTRSSTKTSRKSR